MSHKSTFEGLSSDLYKTIKTPKITYTQPLGLFIDGEWVRGVEDRTFDTFNPHDGTLIATVHEARDRDIDRAVSAARSAFNGSWRITTPSERGRLLVRLADLMERDSHVLAAIEAMDNGKAFTMAKLDVQASADCLRYYGGWADKIFGQTIDTDPDSLNFTRHEPIGVCGQIIPWNFPLMMWAWKVGPALATGNTIVLKTAEQTPLSGLYAAGLAKEAGFPSGVINVVSGLGQIAGAALSQHMDVDKIAFTGSTQVGRTILQASAKSNLKKVTLELGGKSPNIIFNDADLENAVSWVNFGIYFNHGQCCCAGSRILVQEGIYDEFLKRFKMRAASNVVGNPFDGSTFQGPQVSQSQLDRILGYVEEAKAAGATVELGGSRIGCQGYYIQPTIFSNVNETMKIVQEEVFGPVCTVQRFKSEEDAIRIANDTRYGLASGVHTTSLKTALRMSKALKAGTVWVNNYNTIHYQCPFGGFKESGQGRELGSYALNNYTEVKNVRIHLGEPKL